jgi:hypothetical protein
MDKIAIYLESNLIGNAQSLKISVNLNPIVTLPMPVDYFDFYFELEHGDNVISLELCGKDDTNELRENGLLIEDTYAKITNISINDRMMNHLLNDCAHVEVDWDYHKDVADWFIKNSGSVPKVLEKSRYLNLKGTYYFKFLTPVDDFLNTKIPIDKNYEKMYNQSIDRFKQLKNKL